MGKAKSRVPSGKRRNFFTSKVQKVRDHTTSILSYFQGNSQEERNPSTPAAMPEGSGQEGVEIDEDFLDKEENGMTDVLIFLQEVVKRECRKKKLPEKNTLLDYISHHGIIQASAIPMLVKRLEPNPRERPSLEEPEMLKDVLIWLPDRTHRAYPPCAIKDCPGHGSPYDYPIVGRRVIGLKNTFYVISRRYECTEKECTKKFMGYDPNSMSKQQFTIQQHFPVIMTKKQAIHKDLIDIIRPLFGAGVRPGTMSSILQELHYKEYFALQIRREQRIRKEREDGRHHFSSDVGKKPWDGFTGNYGGRVPSPKYLAKVYVAYSKTIRKHLDAHVKARPCHTLSVDASYKEAAKLGSYKGESVFSGLFTATNEYGEIRAQFHTVSDAHDQIARPMKDMVNTMSKFNFQLPNFVFSDKADSDFLFYSNLFNLQNPIEEETEKKIAPCTFKSITDIRVLNNLLQANMNLVEVLPNSQRVFAMEFDRHHALLAISFFYQDEDEEETKIECMVCHLQGRERIPESLQNLAANPAFVILGTAIPALKISFPSSTTALKQASTVDIASLARSRGIGTPEGLHLENLFKTVLEQDVGKRAPMKQKDERFLAEKASNTLKCYAKLIDMPDLTIRLAIEDRREGLEVDIVPREECARAASGVVVVPDPPKGASKFGTWTTPTGVTPKTMSVTDARCIVEINEILAENLAVPGLKMAGGSEVSLGDLGRLPCRVVLPLKMVRPKSIRMSESLPSEHLSYAEALQDEEDDTVANSADAAEVARYSEIITQATKAVEETVPFQCTEELGDVPSEIPDHFSAVVGDCFHAMDRVRVPTQHAFKKPYFVSLRDAFLAWDSTRMEEVKATLKANDWTDEQIQAKLYFHSSFFQRRVPRRILKPSLLYHRVRAVFSVYGKQIDPKTNTPLFNQEAWNKARNVLQQIRQGFLSDPPGLVLYRYKKGRRGGVLYDKYGLAIIECSRGTNYVENFHKQLLGTFGTWRCGLEMADCLLAEERHRHNFRVAIRKRPKFPNLPFYDSWLVDICQALVEANWGVVLFPGWISASNYKATKEAFGTVPLHSRQLGEAVGKLSPDIKDIQALSEDAKFLIRATGVKVPFLPIAGGEERLLFAKLINKEIQEQIPCDSGISSATVAPACKNDIDYERMALAWVTKVNLSKGIFPKLPVYLRKYHSHWMKNEAVKQAVSTSAVAKLSLEKLNQITSSTQGGAMEIRSTQVIPPPVAYCNPRSKPISVGGVQVSPAVILQTKVVKVRGIGQRGKDKKNTKRKQRRCKDCLEAGKDDASARDCIGSAPRRQCPHAWAKKRKS